MRVSNPKGLPRPLGSEPGTRNRRGETLFIDARKLGALTDRVHRDLADADIAQIAGTYHAWKSAPRPPGEGLGVRENSYTDIPGFCKSVALEEIRAQSYVLTPGRYVGAAEVEEDGEPFEEKIARLTQELEAQFEESGKLEKQILSKLSNLSTE